MDILALTYTFNNNLLIRKRDETVLAYNPDNSDMYEMNDIAGEIIFMMKDELPLKDIIDFLSKEYSVDRDTILADTTDLIDRFIELGIIKIIPCS